VTVEIALLQLLTGLSAGMVLFLIAAGMSIIFGTLRIINLAHGSIYMLGTFLCFWLTSRFAHIPGVYWWALLFAPLGIALLGGVIEIFLLRLIYGEHELYTFILTFGLILILGDVCKLIWGVAYHTVSAPWPINGVLPILGMSFPVHGLFLIG
jgi:branched-chain amino acid transport system permease protein